MKLQIEIDAPEEDIRDAIESIPPRWLRDPGQSPIRILAIALCIAYKRAKDEQKKQEQKKTL